MSRRLLKRFQRKVYGGTALVRVYDDGTTRVRFDHPSNDPDLEVAVAAAITDVIMEAWRAKGVDQQLIGFAWKSDA